MKRWECLEIMAASRKGNELVLLDMANISIEWHAIDGRDGALYNLQMGIPIAVGIGLALALPRRRIIACQGDGSLLLNLGVLADLALNHPKNLSCIVFDNECYEAVGRHPTATRLANLAGMAREAGLTEVAAASTVGEFESAFQRGLQAEGPVFIVCKIEPGMRQVKPFALYGEFESTCRFVRHVERSEGISIARPNRSLVDKGWLGDNG